MCRLEPQIYPTGFFQPPTRHDDVLCRRTDVSEYRSMGHSTMFRVRVLTPIIFFGMRGRVNS